MVKDANNHSACTCMVKVVTRRGGHSRLHHMYMYQEYMYMHM